MARGYIRISSRGKIYGGVSFPLSDKSSIPSDVQVFLYTVGAIVGLVYGIYSSHKDKLQRAEWEAHTPIHLVQERTAADEWTNNQMRERAAREGREVLPPEPSFDDLIRRR